MSASTEQKAIPGGAAEQLTLVRKAVRAARPVRPRPAPPAADLPVARVAVDVSLPHLDRLFDYVVPEPLSSDARPGVRVRVRFAGQVLDGFVVDRVAGTDHQGRLERLVRVVSPEPVLTPEIARLARLVADRYAGSLADVLRLAVPPRHAAVEREPPREPASPPERAAEPAKRADWVEYEGGPAFLSALARGGAPRAAWSALPGSDWAAAVASTAHTALSVGRGVLVVVPHARDVARVDAALTATLGPGRHVGLTADLGPAERYRRWLAVRRGAVKAVLGTRGVMLAPVTDLGLVVVWDDGDDLHAEPRAPYPHVREVLCLRAQEAGAAALLGGYVRTAEAANLVATGWAHSMQAARATVRRVAPRVLTTGDDEQLARDAATRTARLPSLAWQVAHDALRTGPVLVQVPRRGYLPALACERCRSAARCSQCAGPLSLQAGPSATRGPTRCAWCGRAASAWRCPHCGHDRFRAQVVGAARTAEELGRAFPSVRVRTSSGDHVLDRVSGDPALIVATPGAEPAAADGYAAALLLDGWVLLARPDLRAAEEALRRWAGAAALVRGASAGGAVVLVADAPLVPVQALVRWDPIGFADRELGDRRALGFPPVARLAALTGSAAAVADLLQLADLPPGTEVLGPVPGRDGQVRALLRVPRARGGTLAAALHAAQGVRSARKAPDPVRVQIDPAEIG